MLRVRVKAPFLEYRPQPRVTLWHSLMHQALWVFAASEYGMQLQIDRVPGPR